MKRKPHPLSYLLYIFAGLLILNAINTVYLAYLSIQGYLVSVTTQALDVTVYLQMVGMILDPISQQIGLAILFVAGGILLTNLCGKEIAPPVVDEEVLGTILTQEDLEEAKELVEAEAGMFDLPQEEAPVEAVEAPGEEN